MIFTGDDHTFVLCAFRESPYLEDCILSLLGQTVKSRILISTSTPNAHIRSMAEKYGLDCFANEGEKGIGGDWNAAYDRAETALITVAHQDDLYEPGYVQTVLQALNQAKDPVIAFCEYWEKRESGLCCDNRNLKIKSLMLFPLRFRPLQNSRFVRRRILSFGSPICCPSVTYVREKVGAHPFDTKMKCSLDWAQWERLSKRKGAFVYVRERLMQHRIYDGSATTDLIRDSVRSEEDLSMFRKFWPEPIAKRLARLYEASEKSNAEP